MNTKTRILVSKLRLDFQLPECLIEETVLDYENKLACGETFSTY